MEGNRREVHLQQTQVLHDEGVHSGAVERPYESLCFGEFVVPKNGVERHVDARAERVGKAAQRGDVFNGVAGSGTCAEARSAYVDGVGAVEYGFASALSVACRCEEFYSLSFLDGGHWLQ